MKNQTFPSKMYLFEIFIFENFCIAKINREKNTSFHKIDKNGETSDLFENYQKYLNESNLSQNYLEELDIPQINSLHLIASFINYDELIGKIDFLINKISQSYKYVDFDMQVAYILEDIKEAYLQVHHFDKEEETKLSFEEVSNLFDQYFYNNTKDLNEDETSILKNQLFKIKKTLSLLKSF